MQFHWAMLPPSLFGLFVIGLVIRGYFADQPPAISREFNRPYWEWQRTNPIGRLCLAATTCIVVLFLSSFTMVYVLGFFGISAPWF